MEGLVTSGCLAVVTHGGDDAVVAIWQRVGSEHSNDGGSSESRVLQHGIHKTTLWRKSQGRMKIEGLNGITRLNYFLSCLHSCHMPQRYGVTGYVEPTVCAVEVDACGHGDHPRLAALHPASRLGWAEDGGKDDKRQDD